MRAGVLHPESRAVSGGTLQQDGAAIHTSKGLKVKGDTHIYMVRESSLRERPGGADRIHVRFEVPGDDTRRNLPVPVPQRPRTTPSGCRAGSGRRVAHPYQKSGFQRLVRNAANGFGRIQVLIKQVSDGCVIELSMILDPSGCKRCTRGRQDMVSAEIRLNW